MTNLKLPIYHQTVPAVIRTGGYSWDINSHCYRSFMFMNISTILCTLIKKLHSCCYIFTVSNSGLFFYTICLFGHRYTIVGHSSSCSDLLSTVTVNSDLWPWLSNLIKGNQQAKRQNQGSISSQVIVWTHRHTHTQNWLLYWDN